MKKIPLIKRPPRRVNVYGRAVEKPNDELKQKNKYKRPSIITPDGRMNEVAAAEYLGMAVSTLQNRRSMGDPPIFRKPHGRVFYHKSDLDAFLGEDD